MKLQLVSNALQQKIIFNDLLILSYKSYTLHNTLYNQQAINSFTRNKLNTIKELFGLNVEHLFFVFITIVYTMFLQLIDRYAKAW